FEHRQTMIDHGLTFVRSYPLLWTGRATRLELHRNLGLGHLNAPGIVRQKRMTLRLGEHIIGMAVKRLGDLQHLREVLAVLPEGGGFQIDQVADLAWPDAGTAAQF